LPATLDPDDAGCAICVTVGRGGNIEGNSISGSLQGNFFGIVLTGLFGSTEYITVKNNFVTGCALPGLADNASIFGPGTEAKCCVFKDNVAVGNLINCDFQDPSTVLVNNVCNCAEPPVVESVGIQSAQKIQVEKRKL